MQSMSGPDHPRGWEGTAPPGRSPLPLKKRRGIQTRMGNMGVGKPENTGTAALHAVAQLVLQ
jgi:hypothetical protein